MLRKKLLPSLVVAVLLVGATACGGEDEGKGTAGEAPASQKQEAEGAPSASEPDLDDVPEVVAEVNGEEIGRDEFLQAYEAQFQQAVAQSQASGQEVDQDQLKKQVADNLVSAELLVQEADARDIAVTDADVDKTLQELAAQNGLKTPDEFVAAMEQQGMDRAAVDEQVRMQVKIERLIEDEAGDLSVSSKEVRALYDQLVAQQEQAGAQAGQQVPPLAQVRPQIEEQVRSQKQSQVAQRLLGELRESGDVVVNV